MKLLLRRCWPLVALPALGGWLSLSAQTGPVIEKIEINHVGPPAVSDDLVRANLHVKAGYRQTKVEPKESINAELGRATVTFEITEAPKVRIVDVQFIGAQAFSQRKLRKRIKTRRHWMFSWLTGSGKFKEEQFQEDQEKLRDFYWNEGFIDFDLKEVKFDSISPTRIAKIG